MNDKHTSEEEHSCLQKRPGASDCHQDNSDATDGMKSLFFVLLYLLNRLSFNKM